MADTVGVPKKTVLTDDVARFVREDDAFETLLLPLGEGLSVSVKR